MDLVLGDCKHWDYLEGGLFSPTSQHFPFCFPVFTLSPGIWLVIHSAQGCRSTGWAFQWLSWAPLLLNLEAKECSQVLQCQHAFRKVAAAGMTVTLIEEEWSPLHPHMQHIPTPVTSCNESWAEPDKTTFIPVHNWPAVKWELARLPKKLKTNSSQKNFHVRNEYLFWLSFYVIISQSFVSAKWAFTFNYVTEIILACCKTYAETFTFP